MWHLNLYVLLFRHWWWWTQSGRRNLWNLTLFHTVAYPQDTTWVPTISTVQARNINNNLEMLSKILLNDQLFIMFNLIWFKKDSRKKRNDIQYLAHVALWILHILRIATLDFLCFTKAHIFQILHIHPGTRALLCLTFEVWRCNDSIKVTLESSDFRKLLQCQEDINIQFSQTQSISHHELGI